MGSVRFARSRLAASRCAAAACAVAALAAAPAQAAGPAAEDRPPDGGGVRVTPPKPRPGDEVELRVHGCAGDFGTAGSEAFVARVRLAPAPGGGLFGEATVRSTAEPGAYPIDVACEAKHGEVSGRLIVAGRDGGRDPGHHEPPDFGDRDRERDPGHGHGSGGHHERPGPGGTDGPGGRPGGGGGEPTGPVRAGGGGTADGGGTAEGPAAAGTTGLTLLSCALVSGALLAVWRLRARER